MTAAYNKSLFELTRDTQFQEYFGEKCLRYHGTMSRCRN